MKEKKFPQYAASFLLNDFKGIASRGGVDFDLATARMPAQIMGSIIKLAFDGFIDRQQLRRVIRFFVCMPELDNETAVDLVCIVKLMLHQFCAEARQIPEKLA